MADELTEPVHEGFSEARIEIHFDVRRPIELVTLTLALQSMARDYRRFMNDDARSRGTKIADEDVKLYVTKVESGSILAELASATPVIGAFFSIMDYQSVFAQYVTNFGTIAEYCRGLLKRTDLKPADIEITKAGAQAIADVMAVVAENHDGNLRLSAVRAGRSQLPGIACMLRCCSPARKQRKSNAERCSLKRCSNIEATRITRMSCCISSVQAPIAPRPMAERTTRR